MGKKFLELSEEMTELTITGAFLGAVDNLVIVEKELCKKKKILARQYFSYLSLLALSIELGLKNIIKITSKVWRSHDLKELFIEADKETNNILSKKFFKANYSNNAKEDFIYVLNDMKDLFQEARYCYGNSLKHFIGDKYFTKKNYIDFKKVNRENKGFIMLRLFLNVLGDYHNYLNEKSLDKNDFINDKSKIIKIIIKKAELQRNITIDKYGN
jgi:hypothetical protein